MQIPIQAAAGKTVARLENVPQQLEVTTYDKGLQYTQVINLDHAQSVLDPLWDRVIRFGQVFSYHLGLKVPEAHTL